MYAILTTLSLCLLSLVSIFAKPAANGLPSTAPADWKAVLSWLQQNYDYPESGPNYDWPSTEKPRIVSNSIMALDGTVIPILPGARDVSLGDGKHSTVSGPYPAVTVKYEVKAADGATLSDDYQKLAKIFRDQYRVNLDSFSRNSPGDYIVVKGSQDGFECELLIPGKVKAGKMNFANGGTFSVEYTARGIAHFYFFRTNLLVVKEQVALTDGTTVPIFPGKKIVEVAVGNVQGTNPPQVHIEYVFYVPDHSQYDS